MTYQIQCGKLNTIGGNFGVFALKDGRVVSSCTGIQTIERCREMAFEYSHNFGNAPIQCQPEIEGDIFLRGRNLISK